MDTTFQHHVLKRLSGFRYTSYLKYVPIVALLLFMPKKLVLYSIFVGITAVIIYYTKLMHFPIDISPLFFLEIVITRYYGLGYSLLYIFLAYIIPKTIAGQSMNWMCYIFISLSMVANVFVLFFPSMPLQTVGFLTSVIQYILGVMFQSSFKPLMLSLADGFANVLNNIVWFLIFSDLIVFAFR
ncbi:MAG: hypothetical protein HGA85_05595 [Nanoarchaeota archaeon]|nr:hypothetical protein [Nanoarchaeota archaeon]